jgi:gluconate 2-dehydrogenase alpha chain
MFRFIAGKTKEIMERMGPDAIDAKDELDPYDIHTYQSTHPTGGAIMGTDPGNSVTNSFGQVWDTPNVFVLGAALFPQNPGVNPTDTVCALTYRTGDAIRDRYVKHERELLA